MRAVLIVVSACVHEMFFQVLCMCSAVIVFIECVVFGFSSWPFTVSANRKGTHVENDNDST